MDTKVEASAGARDDDLMFVDDVTGYLRCGESKARLVMEEVANLDTLMGYATGDAGVRSVAVALVMAALSPVMAELGRHGDGGGR